MKMQSRYMVLILFLMATLLISTLSCKGTESTNAGGVTVQNVAERVQGALLQLNSYETEMEMTMNLDGVVDGESGKIDLTAKANGAADMAARKMWMDMAMSMKGKGGTETIDEVNKISTYIDGDITYVGTTDSTGKMSWQHQTTPSSTWEQKQQIDQFMSLLDNSEIKYLKSEKVQGTQCYLVELDPDLNVLWNLIGQQMGQYTSDMGVDNIGSAVKKVTVKYWFAQDTLFFRKIYINMDMELSAEQMGGTEGQVTVLSEITLDISKHNTSINIKVPEEAKAS